MFTGGVILTLGKVGPHWWKFVVVGGATSTPASLLDGQLVVTRALQVEENLAFMTMKYMFHVIIRKNMSLACV